jgi:demethylmenaquinone methyltransferase/2-methoxy-6-polyprenyl-1,4-benzoquinol methylase
MGKCSGEPQGSNFQQLLKLQAIWRISKGITDLRMALKPMDQTPWTAQGVEKRKQVQAMFAEIAPVYDRLNGFMSLSMHHRWRQAAVDQLALRKGDSVLDVCCGTGDFFAPLRKAIGAEGSIVGVDFCLPMLELARPKDERAVIAIGDACQLPVQSGSVRGVTVGWGIRNVPDIDRAHQEIYRVLETGGRFVSVDCAVPRNGLIRWVSQLMGSKVLPFLGSVFGNKKAYTYLPESTKRFKSREELADSMSAAGFVDVGYRDFMFGNICMHWGRKP